MKIKPNYRQILVPVHFVSARVAPDSSEAVAQAFDLAIELKSDVTLTHVFAGREEAGGESDDGDLPRIRDMFESLVREAESTGIRAKWVFLFGHPHEEICSLAATEKFDLILLGTRRRPGEGATLIGSTAARVIQDSVVPTWVVKRCSTDHNGVVVATDLGDDGELVLRHGTRLARWRSSALHVVNACELVAQTDPEGAAREMMLRRARLEAQMAEVVRDDPVPDFTSHVELGSPEKVIWEVARDTHADVVVVGMREHSDSERLLRAHTAEQVLTELPCSLLTVRVNTAN